MYRLPVQTMRNARWDKSSGLNNQLTLSVTMVCTQGDDAVAVIGLVLATNYSKKQKPKKRKTRCKDWPMKRNRFTRIDLIRELNVERADYRNYLQMNETMYQKLLSLASPPIY